MFRPFHPSPVCITGISLGLPQEPTEYIENLTTTAKTSPHQKNQRRLFDHSNIQSLLNGTNYLMQLSDCTQKSLLERKVTTISKLPLNIRKTHIITKKEQCIQLTSRLAPFDLQKEYPYVPSHILSSLDSVHRIAIAAGLEACIDAGLQIVRPDKEDEEKFELCGLSEELRDETGVIFASSFGALDSAINDTSSYSKHRALEEVRSKLSHLNGVISGVLKHSAQPEYEFDRKLLFKLLVLANCQLAELIGARGPNTHLNSACASTTQALALASDWIRVGRCQRVIVIAGDDVTSSLLLPYVGSGFLSLGAASTKADVREAALPFSKERNGMLLGAGAVGLVVEGALAAMTREVRPKVEIVGSYVANSAFHATVMHTESVSKGLDLFLRRIERETGISRAEIAKEGIYFSHETCTSSRGGCAAVEIESLKKAFGKNMQKFLIANTKGFTGHPMGVGIEDVMSVASLVHQKIPPMANFHALDPTLDLLPEQIPTHGNNAHNRQYVLRFAAGFGSQYVYILYKAFEPLNYSLHLNADSTSRSSSLSHQTSPISVSASSLQQLDLIRNESEIGVMTPSSSNSELIHSRTESHDSD